MKCSNVLILTMAALLVGGAVVAQDTVPDVYASNIIEDEGTISEIGVFRLGANYSELLFEDSGLAIEDIVHGPGCESGVPSECVRTSYIYACDPEAGLIIRFDPAWVDDGPLGLGDVEYVYVGSGSGGGSGNNLEPQCGWFTHTGDLIFTDTQGNGTWLCKGIGFAESDMGDGGTPDDPLCAFVDNPDAVGSLIKLPAVDDVWEPYGQGVTQAGNGDALVVNASEQAGIILYEMDPSTGEFVNLPALQLPGDDGPVQLLDPQGIARLSTGAIYVTGQFEVDSGPDALAYGVQRYVPYRESPDSPKQWLWDCDITLDFCEGYGQPHFMEAAADDTIYVGSGPNGCGNAELWAINGCQAYKVFPNEGSTQNWSPYTIQGIAVSPTDVGAIPSVNDNDYEFMFNDHAYEMNVPDSCVPSMFAQETPVECVNNIILNNLYDDDGYPIDGTYGAAGLYFGDKALAQVYNITDELQTCSSEDDVYHAISAYGKLLNPRIVQCPVTDICDIDNNTECTVLDLTSFFPGAGALPDDGRIGSRGSASFSQFFLVDLGLAGPNNTPTGSFCGFRPPVNNTEYPFTDPMSIFVEGRTIPFKFRVAEITDWEENPEGELEPVFDCHRGPFLRDVEAILSIARIDEFEAIEPLDCAGNPDSCGIFDQPTGRKAPYNLNIRSTDYDAGIYQAVVLATTGEFPATWTYFEIVD